MLHSKQRSAARVTLDILRVLRDDGPIHVTRLLAKSNMNHVRLKPYLEELSGRAWVSEDAGQWLLTPDGRAAVLHLERIERSLGDFGMGL